MCRMGLGQRIKDVFTLNAPAEAPEEGPPQFSVGPESIPPEFFGLTSYDTGVARRPRISRSLAIQCPSVLRGRNLICTPIGGLKLGLYAERDQTETIPELFKQPERDIARSVTFSYLVEDLLFESTAWWRVTEWRGPDPAAGSLNPYNYPLHVRRLEPRSVQQRKDNKTYVSRDGSLQGDSYDYVPDAELIRFDSPAPGVLLEAGGAIMTLLMLDQRAYKSANNPVPEGYFTPKDGIDPFDDDPEADATDDEKLAAYTATKFLADWQSRRVNETTAYVPGGLDYEQLAWDPAKLQLTEARQHAVLEIARAFGLDPEDVAVSTTSRTYFNAETKRQDRVDFVLGMFLNAIQDRLSMGDVTPRGQVARFDTDLFTMTDTKTRLETYQIGIDIGLWDIDEIRAKEGLPPLTPAQRAALAARTQAAAPKQLTPGGDNVTPINRRDQRAANFAGDGEIQLAAMSGPGLSVDLAARTITGRVIPYGGARGWHGGIEYEFAQGVPRFTDPKRVKVYVEHDKSRVVGFAAELDDRPDGLYAVLKIAKIPLGDEALLMADEGLWDGLSAGLKAGGKFARLDDGAVRFTEAPLAEISLCTVPAFDDARVTAVALSADNERNTMKCTKCNAVHAAGVAACDPAVLAAFTATQATATNTATGEVVALETAAFDPVAFQAQLADSIGGAFAALLTDAQATGLTPGAREVVAATRQHVAQFTVTEELPYRFDGSTSGEHCFTDDLRDMQNGNQVAKARLDTFIEEAHQQFAVSTTNAAAFNPVQNRPEMYVPNLRFRRPLWDLVTTGTLDQITAFTVPKFSSASGLVGPHTQGVEPTPGAFAATVQTVTPTAISGKVEINREVWDQGGNPQTDTIVWNEMQAAYFEAAEVNIATVLNALSAATLYSGAEINLAGAVDDALDDAISNLMTDLQFVRGGNRYTAWAADAQLYKALSNARDASNRKLYPLLGPQNASGTIAPRNASIDVNGQNVVPAWALSQGIAANTQNSYFFVPESVWSWLSAPKRFTFEYQVKSIDMAVWGYTASAVLRNSDVGRLDYTTADV